MKKKKQNQMQSYQASLEKYKNWLNMIEQNPDYDYRPDVKMIHIRNCLLKIQELEGKIGRDSKSSPSAIQNTRRVKKAAKTSSYTGMERPYSSGHGAWASGGQTKSYTRTNVRHPYSGGRCSPK